MENNLNDLTQLLNMNANGSELLSFLNNANICRPIEKQFCNNKDALAQTLEEPGHDHALDKFMLTHLKKVSKTKRHSKKIETVTPVLYIPGKDNSSILTIDQNLFKNLIGSDDSKKKTKPRKSTNKVLEKNYSQTDLVTSYSAIINGYGTVDTTETKGDKSTKHQKVECHICNVKFESKSRLSIHSRVHRKSIKNGTRQTRRSITERHKQLTQENKIPIRNIENSHVYQANVYKNSITTNEENPTSHSIGNKTYNSNIGQSEEHESEKYVSSNLRTCTYKISSNSVGTNLPCRNVSDPLRTSALETYSEPMNSFGTNSQCTKVNSNTHMRINSDTTGTCNVPFDVTSHSETLSTVSADDFVSLGPVNIQIDSSFCTRAAINEKMQTNESNIACECIGKGQVCNTSTNSHSADNAILVSSENRRPNSLRKLDNKKGQPREILSHNSNIQFQRLTTDSSLNHKTINGFGNSSEEILPTEILKSTQHSQRSDSERLLETDVGMTESVTLTDTEKVVYLSGIGNLSDNRSVKCQNSESNKLLNLEKSILEHSLERSTCKDRYEVEKQVDTSDNCDSEMWCTVVTAHTEDLDTFTCNNIHDKSLISQNQHKNKHKEHLIFEKEQHIEKEKNTYVCSEDLISKDVNASDSGECLSIKDNNKVPCTCMAQLKQNGKRSSIKDIDKNKVPCMAQLEKNALIVIKQLFAQNSPRLGNDTLTPIIKRGDNNERTLKKRSNSKVETPHVESINHCCKKKDNLDKCTTSCLCRGDNLDKCTTSGLCRGDNLDKCTTSGLCRGDNLDKRTISYQCRGDDSANCDSLNQPSPCTQMVNFVRKVENVCNSRKEMESEINRDDDCLKSHREVNLEDDWFKNLSVKSHPNIDVSSFVHRTKYCGISLKTSEKDETVKDIDNELWNERLTYSCARTSNYEDNMRNFRTWKQQHVDLEFKDDIVNSEDDSLQPNAENSENHVFVSENSENCDNHVLVSENSENHILVSENSENHENCVTACNSKFKIANGNIEKTQEKLTNHSLDNEPENNKDGDICPCNELENSFKEKDIGHETDIYNTDTDIFTDGTVEQTPVKDKTRPDNYTRYRILRNQFADDSLSLFSNGNRSLEDDTNLSADDTVCKDYNRHYGSDTVQAFDSLKSMRLESERKGDNSCSDKTIKGDNQNSQTPMPVVRSLFHKFKKLSNSADENGTDCNNYGKIMKQHDQTYKSEFCEGSLQNKSDTSTYNTEMDNRNMNRMKYKKMLLGKCSRLCSFEENMERSKNQNWNISETDTGSSDEEYLDRKNRSNSKKDFLEEHLPSKSHHSRTKNVRGGFESSTEIRTSETKRPKHNHCVTKLSRNLSVSKKNSKSNQRLSEKYVKNSDRNAKGAKYTKVNRKVKPEEIQKKSYKNKMDNGNVLRRSPRKMMHTSKHYMDLEAKNRSPSKNIEVMVKNSRSPNKQCPVRKSPRKQPCKRQCDLNCCSGDENHLICKNIDIFQSPGKKQENVKSRVKKQEIDKVKLCNKDETKVKLGKLSVKTKAARRKMICIDMIKGGRNAHKKTKPKKITLSKEKLKVKLFGKKFVQHRKEVLTEAKCGMLSKKKTILKRIEKAKNDDIYVQTRTGKHETNRKYLRPKVFKNKSKNQNEDMKTGPADIPIFIKSPINNIHDKKFKTPDKVLECIQTSSFETLNSPKKRWKALFQNEAVNPSLFQKEAVNKIPLSSETDVNCADVNCIDVFKGAFSDVVAVETCKDFVHVNQNDNSGIDSDIEACPVGSLMCARFIPFSEFKKSCQKLPNIEQI